MLRWNPTRTAWKAPALALALLAGPAAVPALAGPAPGQVVPPPTLRSVLLDWSFDPLVAAPLLAVAALYLRGRQRIVERGQRWPAQRTACFLSGLGMIALALQWPIVGVDPTRWRLHHLARVLYVFLMVPFHAFLGVAIMNSGHLLAPSLGAFVRTWGPTPLADQQAGGAIMWGAGDIISLVAVIAILASWASYEEKVAAREDRRIARERAARAQAAQAAPSVRADQAGAPATHRAQAAAAGRRAGAGGAARVRGRAGGAARPAVARVDLADRRGAGDRGDRHHCQGGLLGKPSAPVLVEEYGDFQCPACANFQTAVGPTVRQLADQGRIRFVFHEQPILGRESVLAANAATCAGDQGKFWPYHDLLYAEQAPENSGALTADRLIQLGTRAGIGGTAFARCVRGGTYEPWLRQVTNQGSVRGVNATPSFYVDGRRVDSIATPQALREAVANGG